MRTRITITQRLILISLIVSLPLVAITVYLVVTSVNKDIDFGRWEKMGNAYQRPLEKLLEFIPQHEALARASSSDASIEARRQLVAGKIDAAFNLLAET